MLPSGSDAKLGSPASMAGDPGIRWPSLAPQNKGFQDHHIVSDKNVLTKNHELLDLAEFNLQSRANKIYLPKDGGLHPTRSIHNGKHRTSVSQNLADQMSEVVDVGRQNGFTPVQYDQALRAIISEERQLLRSGQRALNKHHRPGAQ